MLHLALRHIFPILSHLTPLSKLGHQQSLRSRGIDIRSTSVRCHLDYNKALRYTVHHPVLSSESQYILFRINDRKRIGKHVSSLISALKPTPGLPPRSRGRNLFINDVAVESKGDVTEFSSTPSSPDYPESFEVSCTPKKGFHI